MKANQISPELRVISAIVIVGVVMFMVFNPFSDSSNATKTNNSQKTEETNPFDYQKSLGLGTEYLLTTNKTIAGDGTLEIIEYTVPTTLWDSPDNRDPKYLNGKIESGTQVVLIGYRESDDYCKVKATSAQGWTACPNITKLPIEMVDAWYSAEQYEVYKTIK